MIINIILKGTFKKMYGEDKEKTFSMFNKLDQISKKLGCNSLA